jgi:hypothetical protein
MSVKLPSITLTAVVSGRKIALNRLDVPVLLVFLWDNSQDLAPVVTKAVRAKYPEAEQAAVVFIADLPGIPGIFHGIAEREMRKQYKYAAALVPSGKNPADYVMIMPDWKGEVSRALGIRGIGDDPWVALLDSEAVLVGKHQGRDLAEAALDLMEQLEQLEQAD